MTAGDWFTDLYQGSYQTLVLTAYALTNDLGEAEEITQEAFALAYGRRARLSSVDSPEAWLRTVVVKLARRRRRRGVMLDWIPRREPRPVVEGQTEHIDPRSAIREEHRGAVVSHSPAGLPAEEVAAITAPDPRLIADRSRQRAVRRRMRVGALVAVLAVGVVVPLLRGQVEPEPTPTVSPTPSAPDTPGQAQPPSISQVEFADAEHGYALRNECTAYANGTDQACDLTVLGTDDGVNWVETSTIPWPGGTVEQRPSDLTVLGPEEVVLERFIEVVRKIDEFFVGVVRLPGAGAGLKRVDHIVCNVELGKMNDWVDFYARVSDESKYYRFFSPMPTLSELERALRAGDTTAAAALAVATISDRS